MTAAVGQDERKRNGVVTHREYLSSRGAGIGDHSNLELGSRTTNGLVDLLLDLLNDLLDLLYYGKEALDDVRLDLDLVKLRSGQSALREDAIETLALLLEVALGAVHDLLHDAEVVLVLGAERVREELRVLEERVARRGGRVDEALRDAVELGVAASGFVEETADGAVGTAAGIEEVDEVVLVAAGSEVVVAERLL